MNAQTKKKEISAADLGTRYKCYKCGTKFYDLGRPQCLCPSCGEDQDNGESTGTHNRKNKWRRFSMTNTDHAITAPEERDDLPEMHKDGGEHSLDIEGIVLE
jgi:uncharacterized protein (TIGR02300 family)